MKRKEYERPTYNGKYNHWFHEVEFDGSLITLGQFRPNGQAASVRLVK
jgi:hypothetical protein